MNKEPYYPIERIAADHQDDDWDPFWHYEPDCGCELCLEYENEMSDWLEQEYWDATKGIGVS